MRYTYRYQENEDYWNTRWGNLPVDDEMKNQGIYPLKNAIQTVGNDKEGKILEAGCGNGRVLRYFHNRNYTIYGIDFIKSAIDKLKKADKNLTVSNQSILNTDFSNNYFEYILAFGLYHNFKEELFPALDETHRILKKDGILCASFRADNLQNWMLDKISEKNILVLQKTQKKHFHKANFTIRDIKKILYKSHFEVISISMEFNMSFLFKMKIFRPKAQKVFDEKFGRNIGYRLNFLGSSILFFLKALFPAQFCSLYVVHAKPLKK